MPTQAKNAGCASAREATPRLRSAIVAAVATIGMTVLGPAPARGAELRLRAECRARGSLVTLGDVAEILAPRQEAADALAAVELFPAPPRGEQRTVRLREIQDLLLMRGVNLVEHRFSGSNRVVVVGHEREKNTAGQRPVSATAAERAKRQVAEAVVRYLREHVSEDEAWTVEVALDDSQVRGVSTAGRRISVRGGSQPWVGTQRFDVTVDAPEGPVSFSVDARVSVPPAVVIAARSLPRGTLIGVSDVRLERGRPMDELLDGFQSLEEVLGQETTQVIGAGSIVKRASIRPPLLVRRGQIVTVYARSSGIWVRTTARARDDGSLGDLIAVESLEDRRTYFARVSGIEEVEVYARAIRSDQARATGYSRLASGGRIFDRERRR